MSELNSFDSLRRQRGFGRNTTLLMVVLAALTGAWLTFHYQESIRGAAGSAAPAQQHTGNKVPRSGSEAAAKPTQLWTCGMHPQVVQDHPGECPICHMELTPLALGAGDDTQGSATSNGGATVTIDPVVTQNMGLRTTTVEEGPLHRELRVAGFVSEAQTGVRDVNLKISGWIQHLYADTEGMHVQAGDPLFDLYSPQLQVAIEELIALHKRQPAPDSPSNSGSASGALDALEAAAVRKLQLWGIADDEIQHLARLERAPQTLTFRSPITGHIIEKPVVEGDAVEAGERVLRIVDHTTLWIDARVFEQYLPYVAEGQTIVASVPGQGGKTYEGRVVLIHPHLDEMSRTAMVRMAVPNPDLTLRPGMYATVHLTADVSEHATLVPREAVIDTGIKQITFVVTSPGRFEPRKVVMGMPADEGKVQILQGLRAGEVVVVSGQFLLDTESRLQEALRKFLDERSGGAAVPPVTSASEATAEPQTAPAHVH